MHFSRNKSICDMLRNRSNIICFLQHNSGYHQQNKQKRLFNFLEVSLPTLIASMGLIFRMIDSDNVNTLIRLCG
jgi:hypothetical protein